MNKITINDLGRNGYVWSNYDGSVVPVEEVQCEWNDLKPIDRMYAFVAEEIPLLHLDFINGKYVLERLCDDIDDSIDPEYDYFGEIGAKENPSKLDQVLNEIFKGETYFEKGAQIDPYVDYKGE